MSDITDRFAMSQYASRADRDAAMLAEIDRLLIQRDDYKSDLLAMQRERDALRETQAKFGQVQHDLLSQIDALQVKYEHAVEQAAKNADEVLALREQLALADSVRAAQVAGLTEGAEKLRERVKALEDALQTALKWAPALTPDEYAKCHAALKGEA
jgi:chromosome segregation ATPase